MNITTSSKKDRLKRIFTHNLREKLIAAACAAVALLLSFCFRTADQTYTFNISIKTAPEQIIVSQNTEKIDVKVSGTFFDLRKIDRSTLEINFDFSAEEAGGITKTLDKNILPASFSALEIKSISPQTLVLKTEERKTETAPEHAETSPETSLGTSPEQNPAETSTETSPEQKPVETSPETSPEQKIPAAEGKND